jgi:lysophospholipase L1-like esterase
MRSVPRRLVLPLAVFLLVLAFAGTAFAADKYVALGDSYSSGTGTRSYTLDSTCQRGIYAYPYLVAQARPNTSLTFVACSGAQTADVLNNQVSSVTTDTRFVTITIGGNDAGFSSVITQCALPWPWSCDSNITNAQNFIRNTLPGRLDNVYNSIRSHALTATVIVLGYPRLFMGVDCNAGTYFSGDEMTKLNATADLLRDVTSARAAAHGFVFKDAIPPFVGHAVCSSTEWLNGLSNPVSDSYHPNRTGHSSGYAPLVRSITG